jgi:hypothetical protein
VVRNRSLSRRYLLRSLVSSIEMKNESLQALDALNSQEREYQMPKLRWHWGTAKTRFAARRPVKAMLEDEVNELRARLEQRAVGISPTVDRR